MELEILLLCSQESVLVLSQMNPLHILTPYFFKDLLYSYILIWRYFQKG
jgi:hypothetical protein